LFLTLHYTLSVFHISDVFFFFLERKFFLIILGVQYNKYHCIYHTYNRVWRDRNVQNSYSRVIYSIEKQQIWLTYHVHFSFIKFHLLSFVHWHFEHSNNFFLCFSCSIFLLTYISSIPKRAIEREHIHN